MATPSERTFGQELNTWVQTIGIIIAAVWGAYTFIYKEIMLPKSTPVNISVNLQLKKIGTPASQAQARKNALIAVEMQVAAINPSAREVFLLPSAWVVYGVKVVDTFREGNTFAKEAVSSLNSREGIYVEKYATSTTTSVVAIGNLFRDEVLKPNEKATRTLVFHVPPGGFDWLEVQAVMPTMGRKGGATLEWGFDEKNNSLVPVVYRVSASGERKEMEKDKAGAYSDSRLELQMATAMSALSLWQ
jgi:hypothetical protein